MDDTSSLKVAKQIVDSIHKHLSEHPQHLANVVAGPRREGWFNAESFVAVNAAPIGYFAYGEQEYNTVLNNFGYPAANENGQLRPDLVGYNKYNDDSQFILEAKVIYNSDDPSHLSGTLKRLDAQCRQARTHLRDAIVIGVVYVVMLYNDKNLGERLDDDKLSWAERRVIMSHDPAMLDPDASKKAAASNEVEKFYSKQNVELSPEKYFKRVEEALDDALANTSYDWVTEKVESLFKDNEKLDTEMAHPGAVMVSVGIAAKILHAS